MATERLGALWVCGVWFFGILAWTPLARAIDSVREARRIARAPRPYDWQVRGL